MDDDTGATLPLDSMAMTATGDAWSFADAPAESTTTTTTTTTLGSGSDSTAHNGLPRSIFGASDNSTGRTATASHLEQQVQPVSDQRPLATLQPTQAMKEVRYQAPDGRGEAQLLPRVEKDGDDVSIPPSSSSRGRPGRAESTTLTTLSRLFAVQAATSPDHSRQGSYTMTQAYPAPYTRSVRGDRAAALPEHLYSRGLLSGRHSDITVRAFGHEYKLHRLILDRAPFFASALSEPWLEANAREMTVHPEDIDPSITQTAFELALKRLYGCGNFAEEDHDPVGLFATGCWLEMQDLVESSIESMLRQMTTETLSP